MIAKRLSRLYGRRLRSYVYWKVRLDPAYPAVLERLRPYDPRPLLDLGCGVGVFAFFLREHGIRAPIIGVDFDERKIDVARTTATRYRDVDFIRGDVRDPLPDNHNVVLIDVLQYFDTADQQRILANVAKAVPAGGVAILRQGIRDGSLRYRLQRIVDASGRAIRWLRAEKLNFPTRDEIVAAFGSEFEAEIIPLWGRMPYNNYLFVFQRNCSSWGMTNE